MEPNKRILNLIEKFKKTTPNPDKVVEEIEHWYNCKNEIDDGASGEEHKTFKAVKDLIKGLIK